MDKTYNSGLVVLSILVATTGAYVAIEMARRVRESVGRRRNLWLAGGSLAMGLGIWSMHFVGMLALKLAEPVWYDALITLLSMAAAVAGCAIAFAIFARSKLRPAVIGLAAVFMGLAIAGMHYTGMAAMRMPGEVFYDPRIVAASVMVAIVVSFVALIITRHLLTSHARGARNAATMGGAALLMGLAVVGMHYTGMAAATFTAGGHSLPPVGGMLLGNRNLGIIVAVSSLTLLAFALAGARFERWRVQTSIRFESLLELSPQVVWTATASGEITETNQYWYDYTGLSKGDPVAGTWIDAIHPEDRARVVEEWFRSVESGGNLEIEFRLRRHDGVYHAFLGKGRAMRGEHDEIIRWLGIAIDVEDLKIAERELQESGMELEAQTEELQIATQEAQSANLAKSEFLASMSHELRTPLNAIGGYADLLEMGLRGPLTDEQREDIGRIKRSQQHLLVLINDVLNFAKIDAGHLEYKIVDVSIDHAINDTEPMIRPQLKAKGLSFSSKSCDGAGTVRADRDKLQQILLNLFTNAVKFTERGTISVFCESDGNRIRLNVSDTGIGIPEEKIESIFDPFVQVDQRLSQMSQGVGLGLSISRDLARAMGGELVATSALREGSIFTLILPR